MFLLYRTTSQSKKLLTFLLFIVIIILIIVPLEKRAEVSGEIPTWQLDPKTRYVVDSIIEACRPLSDEWRLPRKLKQSQDSKKTLEKLLAKPLTAADINSFREVMISVGLAEGIRKKLSNDTDWLDSIVAAEAFFYQPDKGIYCKVSYNLLREYLVTLSPERLMQIIDLYFQGYFVDDQLWLHAEALEALIFLSLIKQSSTEALPIVIELWQRCASSDDDVKDDLEYRLETQISVYPEATLLKDLQKMVS